ncbi:MAG TPA: hypothetical protein PKA42_01795 [Candidatus Paceibacterota bacterium]|nr:hypothetical protein [Candidatus Paceibacterota bacterium]
MSWVLLATLGQLLNAVVAFLDKYIVSDEKVLPRPFVYAFYSCLLTGGWVIIYFLGYIPGLTELGIPTFDGIKRPSIQVLGMSCLAAYTFFMALVSMYEALKKAEAINVMPVIGATSAVATFGLSYFFLQTPFQTHYMWGVIVLSLGTLLVAQTLPKRSIVLSVFHSGLFFALHFIAMKGLFEETSFNDGFFWSRIGFVIFALSLLMVPAYFDKITEQSKTTTKKTGFIVIATKIMAGVAAFLILKATDLGDVAVVQAMDGLKFVFILLIALLFSSILPDTVTKHETRPHEILRRILYVLVITVGYLILFI